MAQVFDAIALAQSMAGRRRVAPLPHGRDLAAEIRCEVMAVRAQRPCTLGTFRGPAPGRFY